MGTNYSYVNRDKRQFFYVGLPGRSSRRGAIGFGPGARALALLISDCGAWFGDRICILYDSQEELEHLRADGVDIEVDVVLMLMRVDGLTWIEGEIDSYFTLLCNFAFHLRDPEVTSLLNRKFGMGKWQRRYETNIKGNNIDTWSQRVIAARERNLDLFTLPQRGPKLPQ